MQLRSFPASARQGDGTRSLPESDAVQGDISLQLRVVPEARSLQNFQGPVFAALEMEIF